MPNKGFQAHGDRNTSLQFWTRQKIRKSKFFVGTKGFSSFDSFFLPKFLNF